MSSTSRSWRLACWLALAAIAALALWPALARAMAAATGSPVWPEVCTTQGPKRLAVSGGPGPFRGPPAPGQPAGPQHPDACPFCSLTNGTAILPVRQAGSLPPAGRDLVVFDAPPQAPRLLHAWANPQPRGPPSGA